MMPATVLVDVERLRSPTNGLGQVSLNLGRELLRQNSDSWRPVFLVPKNCENLLGRSLDTETASWQRRYLPRIGRRFDVWHVTHQDSVFRPHPGTPYILTIHDLNFLEEKSSDKAERRLKKLQALVNGATRLTVISGFTQEVVEEHLDVTDKPIDVIYNAPCLDSNISPARPSAVTGENFLLALGVVRPKKNLHVLIPFLSKIEGQKLVIAGNTKSDYLEYVLSEAQRCGVADRVIVTGEVEEAEKIWLLQNCTALVFPSLLEGFGLPVIEAMSFGRPVFCSTRTSLPEIGGDQASYWHDFDPDSMADVYTSEMKAFNSDARGSEKLIARANEFNWADAARKYSAVYEQVLAKSRIC